ncbi:hypothetical protein NDI47_02960 [Microcoleus vaginatus GB1-A2]|uniref:hypothetical protein n=1 Tax=Microcoleus vaginatus TaxID=119532 RepID=UPI001682863A|nr:hypothetical protein [Microcoleus sp. FACHB-61]
MSGGGNEDDSILAPVRIATTVADLLQELQSWYNWGNYDSTGVKILTQLGEIGQGDPEAIAALEQSSRGNIPKTRYAAQAALSSLAGKGDHLAIAALEKCHSYWREQERQSQEKAQRRAAVKETEDAQKLGITVEELRQLKQSASSAHQARILDRHGKQQYGESLFHTGQNVICLIENWKYAGQIGIIKRAVNSKFVVVQFDDGYLTIQSDDKFRLVSNCDS